MAQKFITVVISVVFYIAGGCAVGPDYKRPQTTVPLHSRKQEIGKLPNRRTAQFIRPGGGTSAIKR